MIKFDNSIERSKRNRYAIYLRKSRADIEKEAHSKFETLDVHESILRDFLRKNNMRVSDEDVYRELVSGESLAVRYEFQRLMDVVSSGKYTGIVVFDVDRLGRGDMLEYGWILSMLKYTQTLIITPKRTYDPTVPADMQMLQMLMLFAQVEVSQYIFRQSESKEAKCREGQYISTYPLLGYDKYVVNRKKTLKPNKDAELVRIIFEMVASGKGYRGTARELNKAGYRTRLGNFFSPAAISRIITNETYLGKIRWGVTRVAVSSLDGIMKNKKPEKQEKYLLFDGMHEPIVSDELWYAANAVADLTPKVKVDNTVKNPLASILVCAKCGHAMTRKVIYSTNGTPCVCIQHATHTDCERQKGAPMKVILNAVIDTLERDMEHYELLIETGAEEHQRKEIELLESEIASAQRRYSKLVELYISEKIELDVYDAQESALNEQIEQMKNSLEELQNQDVNKTSTMLATTESAIAILRDEAVPAKLKNDFLKTIIKEIRYDNSPVGSKETNITLEIVYR